MTKFRLFFLTTILLSILGCEKSADNANSKPNQTNISTSNQTPANIKANQNEPSPQPSLKPQTIDNTTCYNLKRDDLLLDKKQTFAVDFKPFEKSCFVTFHDPEFDNPPMGAQFFIYQNGKEVFNFPEQFGGANTMCWVDAVAFEDLNDDQLKDVIVIGKCGAKSSDYNENMVYLNTGKGFVTNVNSNAETMDFSKVGQIRDFVKKNPSLFSK